MIKLGINFSACFPTEHPKTLNEYLSGIDKSLLLKAGAYFLGFNSKGSKYSSIKSFLGMFFSATNRELAEQIYANIEKHVKESHYTIDEYEIPYVISSLLFFEYIFDNIPEDQTTTKTHAEMEEDMFKAYLVLNQRSITDREIQFKKIIEVENLQPSAAQLYLQMSFHNADLINFDTPRLFYCQSIRAVRYFQFLSERSECKLLLEEFYKFYQVANYKDYMRKLLGITYVVLNKDKESHTEIHLEDSQNSIFIDKHIAEQNTPLTSLDFLTIRSKPLYKFESDKYRIISPLFVLEMIYNGLYFRIKHFNDKILRPRSIRVPNLYDLKTYQFSEHYILSKVLKEIYGNKYVQKSGSELDGIMPVAPDYYMRNGNHIHLYESKDILITKENKQAIDYRELEEELHLKLFENEHGNAKAVRQIINSIKIILSGEALYDTRIPKKCSIYPILVLHYRVFDTAALNHIINEWFREELEKLIEVGLDISRVHDLILVDIDTLIFNKDPLKQGVISLQGAFLEYERKYLNFKTLKFRPKTEEEYHQRAEKSLYPFSYYLENRIDELGYQRSFDELLEILYSIFEE